MPVMDNKAHSQYVTAFTKQLKYLKANGFTGLCSDCTEFSKLKPNNLLDWIEDENVESLENKIQNDALLLQIPFAGTNFSVKLYFNIFEPWVSPDMTFSDIKFMKYVIDKEHLELFLPTLETWSYLAEDVIAQLLLQLHQLYKVYQLQCLEAEEVLQFEYTSLLQAIKIGDDDIEISLSGGTSWMASLLVRLPLNLKDVPPALIDSNPGPPTCLLHVAIKKKSGVFTPRLYLSKQLESLIGESNTFGLPVVPAGTSLTEYICSIMSLLEDRVKATIMSFEIRKQLVAQLLCCMGTALVEYDAEKFCRISFFLDWKEFHFLLIIDLPDNFPMSCVSLTYRSVYHLSGAEPFSRVYHDVRINQKSTSEEMVETLKTAVLDRLDSFKTDSIASSKRD